ncbi:ABC transporter ATP-binding protein [Calderihabitans maritimus]|uniref:Sugar ABC transporter ATP-binding protein n=1 Tax=Calderihabitans maritimus TaxID=1246530 RepID=A0A1Z5HS67_9FIRM|nr:ABC transporter ATP-binding protein [Calderihabitans maritimus]GAW92366.1 sugar ABC transporter ATP-binding protein [Calderihabitans maritimus]
MRVQLVDVTKKFGGFIAVDNLNMTIEDGEFVALLGPSGCGKTTTLLILAGIYRPSSGHVIFDNRIVNDVLPKDRNLGMCFQSYALYPHMTVFENIAFPLKLRKIPRGEIVKKVRRAAEVVEIQHLLDRKPAQLSGGQQQRVSLARALVKEPGLMLLDEPLSNLDARLRITMRAEIKRLQKNLGITMVFVTHDQTEAMSMADRIAIMDQGRLQDYSTPEELYNRPKNLFIANFIGNPPMNFVNVTCVQEGGSMHLRGPGINLELPDYLVERIGRRIRTQDVVLGVRPEDITLSGRAENCIQGEIYLTEPLGRDMLVDVRFGNERFKVLAPQKFRGQIGEPVNMYLKLDKIHLFDKKDGFNLLY